MFEEGDRKKCLIFRKYFQLVFDSNQASIDGGEPSLPMVMIRLFDCNPGNKHSQCEKSANYPSANQPVNAMCEPNEPWWTTPSFITSEYEGKCTTSKIFNFNSELPAAWTFFFQSSSR